MSEVIDEIEEDTDGCIRAKWTMDGAKTLSEAAKMLREFAESLEQLEKEGWQLTQEIADDYGWIRKEEIH